MEQLKDSVMEYTDDESYEMVGSDCSHFATSDSEEESYATVKCRKNRTESFDMDDENDFDMGFATESDQESYAEGKRHNGTESSDSDNEHEFRKCGIFHFRTIGYQKSFDRFHKLSAYLRPKEDMEIKDVVRNHVLPFLPAKSLIRFKTVSKDWDQWIASPLLALKNSYLFRDVSGFFYQPYNGVPSFRTLDQSVYGIPSPSLQFLPESIVIRSSCNGLLLCQGCDGENLYYICNPANKEWKVLPRPNYFHGSEPAVVLVFEPSELNIAADYKVICAFHLPDMPVVCFDIYSSEERTWRNSAAECFELGFSTLMKGGFYMKGFAYWETSCGKVLAFDMVNEYYGILPLPSNTAPGGVLTEMHGELCYIHAHNGTGNSHIVDIHGGIDMCLRQSVVIDLELGKGAGRAPQKCQALPCVNGDVMMILIGKSLYSYHLRDKKAGMISMTGNDSRARYLPYVNSLVSLAP